MTKIDEVIELINSTGLTHKFVFNSFECEFVEHGIGIIGFENVDLIPDYIKLINDKGNLVAQMQLFTEGPFTVSVEEIHSIPEGDQEKNNGNGFVLNGKQYFYGIIVEEMMK